LNDIFCPGQAHNQSTTDPKFQVKLCNMLSYGQNHLNLEENDRFKKKEDSDPDVLVPSSSALDAIKTQIGHFSPRFFAK
jgi:hypothetical protein